MKGKKIILGITGGIAAYKAAILVRLFIKKGAEVQVVLTPFAREFVTPLTLATLSQKPVLVDFFKTDSGDWHSHVDLGLWADLFLIAPATANSIGKMAHGIADNLLLTTYLSARCPVMLAPTMDLDMFKHQAFQRNLNIMRSYGHTIIEPSSGELASGLSGKGRMEEPEVIAELVEQFFQNKETLSGKTFMVTAGPTYEKIDPVRFIGNFSSGKMGFAIAEQLANCGAKVILICGPTYLQVNHPLIECEPVMSADQMFDACMKAFPKVDGAVMNAAVSDYKPVCYSENKIKRKGDRLTIELEPNRDIAAELGKIKEDNQVLVGFALETDQEIENSQKKLKQKNLDLVVLNSLKDAGAGFQHDTNKVTIIDANNNIRKYELKAKAEVAKDVVESIIEVINQ